MTREVSKPTISPESQWALRAYPHVGTCDNCKRDRVDLFRHPDGHVYCVNVFACEYRYYIQGEREAERGI